MIEDGSSFKPAVLELGDIQVGVGLFGLDVYEETGGSLLEGQCGVVMALLIPVIRKREEEWMCKGCQG